MIEITVTETAKNEILRVLKYAAGKSVRIIQKGFG